MVLWLPVGAISIAAVLFTLWPGDPVLNYGWIEGLALRQEHWRWLTAHLTHLNPSHLLLNLSALFALAFICRRQGSTPAFWGAFGFGLLALDAGLAWGGTGIQWYLGLSGCLHGVFAWLVLRGIAEKRGHRPALWLLFALGLLKTWLETGLPLGSPGLAGIPLAPAAHLFGYLGGCAWALISLVGRDREPG